MRIPPEITVKGFEMTPALERLLEVQIARLEKVCDYITSIRIAIEEEQNRHQTGNPYRIRLDIRVPPNHELVTKHQSVIHRDMKIPPKTENEPEMSLNRLLKLPKFEPLPTAIRSAFDSVRRQLEKLVELQRKEIKTHHNNQVKGYIEKMFRDDAYGFIRAIDGEQIYFHKNSTLHDEWERLQVGTGVRFVEEEGEKGLQASSLELVEKPGVSEMHGELHELPVVAKNTKLARRRTRAGIPAA